jgi:hypothetical protein
MHKTMTAIASALTILVCASSWLSCGSGGLLFEPDTALPHLPAGFTTLIDEPWNEVAPPNWSLASFGQNKVSLAQDASAPRSPSSVLQFRYPAGDPDVGGEGAGARSYDTADYSQYYIAFWYKHSSNWVYHDSCYNKLLYFANNSSSGDNEGIVHDCNGELAVTLQNDISERYESNFGGGYTMALGQWHFIEILMIGSTNGQSNGRLEWWVDGVQRGRYLTQPFKSSGDAMFNGIDLDPIWGGGPQTAPATQYYWLDHLVVKGKN